DESVGIAAVAVTTATASAALGSPVLAVDDVSKTVGAGNGADDDIAALAAVTAVGPAARDVFLAAEAQATVPPVSTANVDFNPINEHDNPLGKTRTISLRSFYPTGRTFPKSEARNPKPERDKTAFFRIWDFGFGISDLARHGR